MAVLLVLLLGVLMMGLTALVRQRASARHRTHPPIVAPQPVDPIKPWKFEFDPKPEVETHHLPVRVRGVEVPR